MMHLDKGGQPFEIRHAGVGDISPLVDMYNGFSPKGRFQGLPPVDKLECDHWVKKMLEDGENYLAWRDERVIGHMVVLPDIYKGDAEYLIFVDGRDRGVGVGTLLTRAAIKKARELGLHRIWLTVDVCNIRATRLYKKCGFTFYDSCGFESERVMQCIIAGKRLCLM